MNSLGEDALITNATNTYNKTGLIGNRLSSYYIRSQCSQCPPPHLTACQTKLQDYKFPEGASFHIIVTRLILLVTCRCPQFVWAWGSLHTTHVRSIELGVCTHGSERLRGLLSWDAHYVSACSSKLMLCINWPLYPCPQDRQRRASSLKETSEVSSSVRKTPTAIKSLITNRPKTYTLFRGHI